MSTFRWSFKFTTVLSVTLPPKKKMETKHTKVVLYQTNWYVNSSSANQTFSYVIFSTKKVILGVQILLFNLRNMKNICF